MVNFITNENDLMDLDNDSAYFIFEKDGTLTSDVLFFKNPDQLIAFLLEEIQNYGTPLATLRTATHFYEVKKRLDGKYLH
ncbi:MAG: hypothetical protein CMD38_07515 [Flavobacteriales bacterium]|nr:hypothetical protein [Flavobacteriales bacterium]|tara:strand:+ start:17267 stop:17506 length:240 start_codon:yes stop_codon:yes gene_type:complete